MVHLHEKKPWIFPNKFINLHEKKPDKVVNLRGKKITYYMRLKSETNEKKTQIFPENKNVNFREKNSDIPCQSCKFT